MSSVSIKNFTRQQPKGVAGLPFSNVAKAVLPDWDISLVFAGSTRARSLNMRLRNKTYVPNVLSYALSTTSGEIIICLPEAVRQAPLYEMTRENFVLYLFIHGLLHLEGRAHGVTMEACEQKLLAKFAEGRVRTYLHVTKNSNRNRHRHLPGKTGRR